MKIICLIITLFASSSIFSQSLVGFWGFNEGADSLVSDSSGYSNIGMIHGAEWCEGKSGHALLFNDSLDHVQIPTSGSLASITNEITISAWVQVIDRNAEWTTLIQRSDTSKKWFDFQIYLRAKDTPSKKSPAFRIDFNGNHKNDFDENIMPDTVLAEGKWYYIACTYDGQEMRFYIDGVLMASKEKPGGVIPNSGRNIWVGSNETWLPEYYFGKIDELRIYNKALTATEIINSMNTVVLSTRNERNYFPSKINLHQNYPNPFNPSTKIRYELNEAGNVSLKVYDLLGNEVADLVNEYKNAGIYEADFNAANLSNGIYFYTLTSSGYSETKKLTLLK